MGHGRINPIYKLTIAIKLVAVWARLVKTCLRHFFYENIKRLAPDAVTWIWVE